MHLGIKIKIARQVKGLTQQELADKIGKTRPLISHIEQLGEVNHQTLEAICKALDMSIEDIEVIVNEPTKKGKTRTKLADVQDDNDRLREENATLKDLVKSQKDVIEMLKAKQKKR